MLWELEMHALKEGPMFCFFLLPFFLLIQTLEPPIWNQMTKNVNNPCPYPRWPRCVSNGHLGVAVANTETGYTLNGVCLWRKGYRHVVAPIPNTATQKLWSLKTSCLFLLFFASNYIKSGNLPGSTSWIRIRLFIYKARSWSWA